MVRHWLETPVNGYLGSGYGADTKSLLQRAQTNEEQADTYLQKLRQDVVVLEVLPADAVSLFATLEGVDRLRLNLDVAGRSYDLSDAEGSR